jgi:predicted transcriptional regulator
MTLFDSEEAGILTPAPPKAATEATRTDDSQPTQLFTTLSMLMEADEVCSSEFFAAFMPRFSVAIHKLRSNGYLIAKRQCDRHRHRGTCWLYKLEALPRLFDGAS